MNTQHTFLLSGQRPGKRSGRVEDRLSRLLYVFAIVKFILHESFVVHRSSVSHWKIALSYMKREWFEAQLQFFDQLQMVLLFVVRPKKTSNNSQQCFNAYLLYFSTVLYFHVLATAINLLTSIVPFCAEEKRNTRKRFCVEQPFFGFWCGPLFCVCVREFFLRCRRVVFCVHGLLATNVILFYYFFTCHIFPISKAS